MPFSRKNSIEDLIRAKLQHGPTDTAILIADIQKKRPKTTKQGVYAVLRNLRREEIVILHNKKASFNLRWLKQMERFFAVAEQHYVDGGFGRDNFLNLRDGEKIAYHFSTPAETDKFWGHALIILAEASASNNEPVYLYNPHEWFLIAREKSERECIAVITKKRRFLLVAGRKTPLDRAVAKEFDGNTSQYHMLERPLFTKNNYYLNIVGDFLIEVWLDPHIAASVETLYQKVKKLTEEVRADLIKTVSGKGKSKLVISRNAKKVERLKNMLKKNFYIPVKQGTSWIRSDF